MLQNYHKAFFPFECYMQMIGLYQDPQGEHIFSSRSGMSHPESESSSSAARKSSELVRKNTTVVLGGDNVEILKTKIAQLQDKLTKLEVRFFFVHSCCLAG